MCRAKPFDSITMIRQLIFVITIAAMTGYEVTFGKTRNPNPRVGHFEPTKINNVPKSPSSTSFDLTITIVNGNLIICRQYCYNHTDYGMILGSLQVLKGRNVGTLKLISRPHNLRY